MASKSKKSESRRSSILKPCKPRQPLQNVNFNSSSSENSPATSKLKRRVSFAEKKHVKEFCHSTEQGTVWDNTYEEHDLTLKSSSITDSSTETELQTNALEQCIGNSCKHVVSESNSTCLNNLIVSNQPYRSVIGFNDENNDIDDTLDLTNPVESSKRESSQLRRTISSCQNTSDVSCISIASSNLILENDVYNVKDEECIQLSDLQQGRTVEASLSNIVVYQDSNEENCVNNVDDKYSKFCKNVEFDQTLYDQDSSMELTAAIPVFLLSSCSNREISRPVNSVPLNVYSKETFNADGLTNDTIFHDASMEVMTKASTRSKEEITDMIACKSTENLHRDKDTYDASCSDEKTKLLEKSMEFTEAIPVSSYQERMFNIVHSTQSTEENMRQKNTIDETELGNNSPMEMTSICEKENIKIHEPVFEDNRTVIFHNASMEMTKAVSTRNKKEITDMIAYKLSSTKDLYRKKDTHDATCLDEKTKLLHKSMEFTETVPVSSYQERMFNIVHSAQSIQKNVCEKNQIDESELCNNLEMEMTAIYEKENIKIHEPVFEDNRTVVFHNASMEMTKAVSTRNKEEITDIIACKLSSTEDLYRKKDTHDTTCLDEKTKLLQKSMEFTETVPVSSYQERMCNIVHSAQSIQKNVCEKNQIDESELCNNLEMEMTTIYEKENMKIREPLLEDNRTMVFHNASIDMTKAIKNKQDITDVITHKSLSSKNSYEEKDTHDTTCFNEKTKLLHTSMEFTEAVTSSRTSNIVCATQSTQENIPKGNERIVLCDGSSMEMTNICENENIKIDKPQFKDNSPILSHDVSVEMTKIVTSKNREKVINPIVYTSISGKDAHTERDSNDLSENNKLLHKSMKFTEAASTFPYHKRTLNNTQSSSFSQIIPRTCSPPKMSTESVLQTDGHTNEIIRNISMEITAAVPSALHFTQDVNKTRNLIISESNESQSVTLHTAAESEKSLIEENLKIFKETDVEIADAHNKSDAVARSSSNSDYPANTSIKSVTGIKRISEEEESEESSSKRRCTSFVETRRSQEYNVHSSPVVDSDHLKPIEYEHLIEDTMNHEQTSNLRDTLKENNEDSFLRKSFIESNCVELQSISSSFVSFDNEKKNSFSGICKTQLETSPIVNDILINQTKDHNNSHRLITNVITESDCLSESRKEVARDHFTISNEKEESINIENNEIEHCSKGILRQENKSEDDQETICQETPKIIITAISNSRNNESNYCTVEKHGKKGISSMINRDKSIIVPETDKDQIAEKKYAKEKTNDAAKLKNSIGNKEQCLNEEESLKAKQCIDHLKKKETIIEHSVDQEYFRENINDKVRTEQRIEQERNFANERLEMEQCISTNKDESLQDPFLLLSQKLETHAESDDCIWNIYHKNIERKMIVFGFISNSLLITMFLSSDHNYSEEDFMKEIKVVSLLADDSGKFSKIVHGLILEKINTEILTHFYRSQEDVLPMLDFVSQEVKLAMDFVLDLKRLNNLNLMEIACDKIFFVARSKQMDIILKVAIKIKRFDKLTSNDINIHCILGKVRETDVKSLIRNIKKDHKFLRRFMNDVKDYIDIMEETSK